MLKEDFLEDLIHLEELVLCSVVISIDSNAQYLFKTLIKLKELRLTGVEFGNLKSTYFDYLVNLEKLDLHNSSFDHVEESPFRNLENLNYLNLSSCRAYRPLDKSFFAGMFNLKNLILFKNKPLIESTSTESKKIPQIELKKESLSDFENKDLIVSFSFKSCSI